MIFYEFSRASFVDFFYQSFVADWLIFKTPRFSIGQTLISTLTKFLFNWATMKNFILTQWRGDWLLSIAGLSVRIDLLVIFIIVFLLALYTNLKTGSFVEINFSTGNTGKKKKNRKVASPFFPPLTVKSCLKWFSLLGPLYGYITSERTKCEKGQNCPSLMCVVHMLYFKRKWYPLKFTMHKLLLRDQLFFKSLILTRTTTISIVHLYRHSIISFFIVSLT